MPFFPSSARYFSYVQSSNETYVNGGDQPRGAPYELKLDAVCILYYFTLVFII